jgi:hypothetical protein
MLVLAARPLEAQGVAVAPSLGGHCGRALHDSADVAGLWGGARAASRMDRGGLKRSQ